MRDRVCQLTTPGRAVPGSRPKAELESVTEHRCLTAKNDQGFNLTPWGGLPGGGNRPEQRSALDKITSTSRRLPRTSASSHAPHRHLLFRADAPDLSEPRSPPMNPSATTPAPPARSSPATTPSPTAPVAPASSPPATARAGALLSMKYPRPLARFFCRRWSTLILKGSSPLPFGHRAMIHDLRDIERKGIFLEISRVERQEPSKGLKNSPRQALRTQGRSWSR